MGTWEDQNKRGTQRKQAWVEEKAFDFQTALSQATNEEEVKAAYIREFSLPANMKERHDLKVDKILFEFKYSVDFDNLETSSKIISQAIYYIRRLYVQGRIDEVKYLVVADKDEAKIFKISEFYVFFADEIYNWNDFRPSSPDSKLINAVRDSKVIESNRTYKILDQDELVIFSHVLYKILCFDKESERVITSKEDSKSHNPIPLILGVFMLLATTSILFIGHRYIANISQYLFPETSEGKGER